MVDCGLGRQCEGAPDQRGFGAVPSARGISVVGARWARIRICDPQRLEIRSHCVAPLTELLQRSCGLGDGWPGRLPASVGANLASPGDFRMGNSCCGQLIVNIAGEGTNRQSNGGKQENEFDPIVTCACCTAWQAHSQLGEHRYIY